MVRATIHFSWAICMRQDVALPACLFFLSALWGEWQGRREGWSVCFYRCKWGTYSYWLNNVSKDSNFYQRIVTCSSFKSMYWGPWYGRWKNHVPTKRLIGWRIKRTKMWRRVLCLEFDLSIKIYYLKRFFPECHISLCSGPGESSWKVSCSFCLIINTYVKELEFPFLRVILKYKKNWMTWDINRLISENQSIRYKPFNFLL